MRRLFYILILLGGQYSNSYSQIDDLIISLLIQSNFKTITCQDLYNYGNLIKTGQKGDTCVYKCNNDNFFTKADSIVLKTGMRSELTGDNILILQYYNNLDTAKLEYKNYVDALMQEFKSDMKFYNYKLLKTGLAQNSFFEDIIKLHSVYLDSVLYITLIKRNNSFIIYTGII